MSFEKALVTQVGGGLKIEPLYTEGPLWLGGRSSGLELAALRTGSDAATDGPTWSVGGVSPAAAVEEVDGLVRVAGDPAVHAIDAIERGAGPVTEVSIAIARWLDALRAGRTPVLATALGSEAFVEVAKLRALRVLATRTAAALGITVDLRVVARTSLVSFSRIEPETNALRATLATFAGIVGGADLVATAPFDALSGATERGARLAFTTGPVLALEGHLGDAADPAHGSYFFESLTAELVRLAWDGVRELERAGGVANATGLVEARIERDARERQTKLQKGLAPRVGASKLARADAPLSAAAVPTWAHVQRDTLPLEALRDAQRAQPTAIYVVGDPRKLSARLDFTRDALAVMGASSEVRSFPSFGAAVAAARSEALGYVAVCADDADLGAVSSLAEALAPRRVLVAGRPGEHEAALRAAGVAGFVALGSDLVAVAESFFVRGES